jgi:hypothetical protein
VQDILQDNDGDLLMVDGDIQYGESTYMHQADILLARAGEYRLAPLSTVGIEDFIDDEQPDELNEAIRIKMRKDGMHFKKIEWIAGQLKLDAPYE